MPRKSSPKKETKTFYLCGADWQEDTSEASVILYKSIESLKKHNPCVEQCGIVKLEIEVTWIQKQDFSKAVSIKNETILLPGQNE